MFRGFEDGEFSASVSIMSEAYGVCVPEERGTQSSRCGHVWFAVLDLGEFRRI